LIEQKQFLLSLLLESKNGRDVTATESEVDGRIGQHVEPKRP